MPTFAKTSKMPVAARSLFDWHARPGALRRLLPPWQPMRVVRSDESIRDGAQVVMDVRVAPQVWTRWVAEHFGCVEPTQFQDRQLSGPFASWVHTHRMIASDPTAQRSALAQDSDQSELHDQVEYELPLGAVGRTLGARKVERELARMFAFRHARTRNDLGRHAAFADRPRQTVAVSGASGSIAQRLTPFLTTSGHTVRRLVRAKEAAADAIAWDALTGAIDIERLRGCDALVHLAGKNIATRWTETKKREFWQSRVDATRRLCETLAAMQGRPSVLIAASAVGYYGDRGDEVLDESSPPGDTWLSEMCVAWERATQPAVDAGIRVVNLRIGVALAADGGALPKMVAPTRMGLGGPVGGGRQWMPWIAMDDLVYVIHHALMDAAWRGPINAVAGSVRQGEFAKTLAQVLHRPAIAPLPAMVVTTLFGEMGREVLLASADVRSTRLNALGFRSTFHTLEDALRFELGR